MTPLPPPLLPYRKKAEKLIEDQRIQAIEFSGRTYQVNVDDPEAHEAYWAFIHLTEKGDIADSFCQCSEETESDWCAHLAAGFLKIYNNEAAPLHVRYATSFWRELFFHIDERLGSKKDALKKSSSFKITPKTKKGEVYIKELIDKSVPPTEENSLKFSDLTEEELEDVRTGHLTPKLHYEFSFWSDLAKTLLLLQENKGRYHVVFDPENPARIEIDTKDLHIACQLKDKELGQIVPFIKTIVSNMPIKGGFQDRVESLNFDKNKDQINLDFSSFDTSLVVGHTYGEWIYKKGEGFYLKEKEKFLKSPILKNEIGPFLSSYGLKISSKKRDFNIDLNLNDLKADLFFDAEGRLHIEHYLFEKKDLSYASHYEDWVYIPEKGFFRVFKSHTLLKKQVLDPSEVYNFVMTHQSELNEIEGYKVHLKALEAIINYYVDDHDSLHFTTTLRGLEAGSREYGALVYIPEQGFFLKSTLDHTLPIKNGAEITPAQIPSFIRSNEAELKLVPHFFLRRNPFQKWTLSVVYRGDVEVIPHLEPLSELAGIPFRFYEDYVYFRGEGFFHLPVKNFIPEGYRERVIIPKDDYANFFYKAAPILEPFVEEEDPLLRRQKKFHFKCLNLNWDELQGKYKASFTINGYAVDKLLSCKDRFQMTPEGLFDREDIRLSGFLQLFDPKEPNLVSSLQILKLLAQEDIEAKPEAAKILDEFLSQTTPIPANFKGFKSKLRPYQEVGVNWLWFLYCHRLSGLLCDDMGLGKTHQAMGLIAAIHNLKPEARFLVVCPTSVLHHWEEKLKQFFPSLKVAVFHGQKRVLSHADLLVTSYGILRNEIESIKQISFEAAIFDEIQLAKNHLSRIHISLKQVKSLFKLGLTGTPVENRLRELKSLFDIVLPDLMPPEAEYIQNYLKPIEKDDDGKVKARLQRLIKPFLLRRKKEEVLFDLPEKTEEISHADLYPKQKEIYDQAIGAAKQTVIRELLDDKKLIPYIHIFALLSSLKKICNHPALYLKDVENYKKYQSGKFELFVELLEEALGSEQKVVVFSHFLGMLDIIEAHLNENGIGYASLRGSTVNRREVIDRFKNDPSCKVFVASLQAGGLGIDLTKASVVIHYDRWWNAARENQATDRVHRIGQTRGVQVFKLVTLASVEERINEMIEKKKKMMEDIVGSDESQVIKAMTREELIELLRT